MKYIITLNGKKYEVTVEKGEATAVYAGTAETAAPAEPVKTEAASASEAVKAVPAETVSGTPVKSPMPGTILDVRVSEGQSVKEGQVLFILEAMKMENEVAAPADGTIASVNVTKGSSVQTDQTLAVLQ